MDFFKSNKRFQTVIWFIKCSFLFIGIISTVALLKFAIPYSFNLLVSTLPRLWFSFQSWLAPPYLYFLLNFIIIGIVASSNYQERLSSETNKSSKEEQTQVEEKPIREQQKQSNESLSLPAIWLENDDVVSDSGKRTLWPENDDVVSGSGRKTLLRAEKLVQVEETLPSEASSCLTDFDETTLSVSSVKKSSKSCYRRTVSSTVPSSSKSKPSLGVTKVKKHDSLDSTWKAITEGRGKPLTRSLKKSDTWDVPPRPDPEPGLTQRELRKSETFNDAASSSTTSSGSSAGSTRGGGGLRRESSLSQDELNRRVEAFIKKFNNEIRLQREDSYNRYLEMVNRGVY